MKLPRNRKLNRLKDYDYSQVGCYFITLCTKDREELFGEVINNEMVLNQLGEIVDDFWQQIPEHYKNIELEEFVVMPNHLHGIIVIKEEINISLIDVFVGVGTGGVGTGQCPVPTKMEKYGQLSKIINSFKGVTTKEVKQKCNHQETLWQRSFYDHVIFNEPELIKIRDYIENNPLKWGLDRNNQENILM